MKRTALILAFIAAVIATAAQSPVKWRVTARLTSADAGIATIKAVVEPGWHLYSTDLPDGGPKPTTISLSGSRGVKFKGSLTSSSRPVEKADKNFGIRLSYWEETVTFSIPFVLDGPCDKAVVAAKVSYMACDDNTCTPPKTVEISSAVLPAKK